MLNHATMPSDQESVAAAVLASDEPTASSVNSPSYQDSRRARELYRYFRPDDITFERARRGTSPNRDRVLNQEGPESPNIALTTYSQLAALRCHAQRAMISLIDKEVQYFVAEASKTLDLEDNNTYEEEGDALWAGCQGVSKEGRLCERTIELSPVNGESYPIFTVNDLSKDSRFNQLPFVTGPPYFRFYAGTPVTTKRGINIGSLFVLDDKPRDGLTKSQQSVLGVMASQCMAYLETYREAMEGRRSIKMSDALNCFVEGKASLTQDLKDLIPGPFVTNILDKKASSSSRVSDTTSQAMSPRDVGDPQAPAHSAGKAQASIDASSGSDSNSMPRASESKRKSDDARGHPWTFARAANLIRESLELEGDSGVVFFDASRDLTFGTAKNLFPNPDTDGNNDPGDADAVSPEPVRSQLNRVTTTTSFDPFSNAFPPHLAASTLASSTSHTAFAPGNLPHGQGFPKPVDRTALLELLKRYPTGKLWLLDEDGTLSSSEDDNINSKGRAQSVPRVSSTRSTRRQLESDTMMQHFPGAKQLLFVPLWDPASSRWFSGCFVYSTAELRVFSSARELTFLNSFGKTVMAECSRLDTLVSDRQKGDFIGSVSHELRSPLHGILASSEFLNDTDTDSFQKSLIETIEGCGRTLLDTINHVLDFSKINSFERTWKSSKGTKALRNGSTGGSTAIPAKPLPTGAPPLLRLYASTDLAAITEEVIEGVFIGKAFQEGTTDITDTSASTRGRNAVKTALNAVIERAYEQPVEVILYIESGDWVFMTQPGAVRRVIMNIFGNAVKYTTQGTIKVRLQLRNMEDDNAAKEHTGKIVDITVMDTGKGISQAFLQSKLYVPFAQENTLAPGTGLGLSIVRSITNMLGGNIDIRSEVGRGTTVKVSLPLLRPVAGDESPVTTPSMSLNSTKELDDSIQLLQQEAKGRRVAIDGLSLDSYPPALNQHLGSSQVLAKYITDWYGLDVVPWSNTADCDVLITDERNVAVLGKENVLPGSSKQPGIIVLCGHSTQGRLPSLHAQGSGQVVEFLSKPYGPYKLARALRACLEKLNAIHRGNLPPITEVISPCIQEPHSLDTVIEGLQEVTLAPHNKSDREIVVQSNGTITIAENSKTAHLAVATPASEDGHGSVNDASEYPFPSPKERLDIDRGRISPKALKHKLSLHSLSESHPRPGGTDTNGTTVTREAIAPRVLLVDDNQINLRLLQTFMKKRKYKNTGSAEDGKMAVEAVQRSEEVYDIIFMDISMPVMNGFEATRAIREFEAQTQRVPAMIIALTGLASSRDQSEAFSSGIDLYLTKPVSFKEVAKLLDNWEANRHAQMVNGMNAGT